ncbi:MAG: HD domain-containing protein [Anaeromyxobacter sp.]
MDALLRQLGFIREIDKLKTILRKTRLICVDRRENDAEHSWHLAMMAVVLAEHANEPIDLLRVMKMVLIHDVVEIDAGDTFIYDTTRSHANTEAERQGAQRIFGLLPAPQAAELIALWEEFEAGRTADARFAKALDRLEPILQNAANRGGTWVEFGVDYERVHEKKQAIQHGSEALWAFTERLLQECVEQGFLKKG